MAQTKRQKKRGRKKKTRSFAETRVGYYLLHKTPLEYKLIVGSGGADGPDANLIELIGYFSLDPYFKTPEFRKALIEYRRTRLHPKCPIKPQVDRELRYIEYRKKRIAEERSNDKMIK